MVVNVHHFANQITDYLDAHNYGVHIYVSDETEQLLDTGGGIKRAASLFDQYQPVLIHNVDILSNVDLAAFYRHALETKADALLLVSRRVTQRYLIFDSNMRLVGWTNVATGEVKSPHARYVSCILSHQQRKKVLIIRTTVTSVPSLVYTC